MLTLNDNEVQIIKTVLEKLEWKKPEFAIDAKPECPSCWLKADSGHMKGCRLKESIDILNRTPDEKK